MTKSRRLEQDRERERESERERAQLNGRVSNIDLGDLNSSVAHTVQTTVCGIVVHLMGPVTAGSFNTPIH